MKKTILANRIKELRKHAGFSQEKLAELSGLGLRTIQRIEQGETEPRGNTLTKIAESLQVSTEQILVLEKTENNSYLMATNLSALGFLFFPLLNILIPLILWLSKKESIKNLDCLGRKILNFQLTWTLLYILSFMVYGMSLGLNLGEILNPFRGGGGIIKNATVGGLIIRIIGVVLVFYIINIFIIVLNAVRIHKKKNQFYFPGIPFFKKRHD